MFADQPIQLRKKNKMTQEILAEKYDVSRQAAAKWENNVSLPDIIKMVLIADMFHMKKVPPINLDLKSSSENLNHKLIAFWT